jgi:uracil-DNA glycosylase
MTSLLKEVYRCTHCAPLGLPFVDCMDAGRWFRFPPTIGAPGPAQLLFVGINPRVSDSNRHLHTALMHDFSTFHELAGNRFRNSDYIGANGLEGHYSMHVWIANRLFPERTFASVAAVTELFFCASESSTGLPVERSPCADKYFGRVLAAVSPKVVFAVGRRVESYMTRRFPRAGRYLFATWGDTGKALIVPVTHPNSWGEKQSKLTAAAETARAYLLRGDVPPSPGGRPMLPPPELPRMEMPYRRKFERLTNEQGGRECTVAIEGDNLARRVDDSHVADVRRDWTGNDDSARNHHSVVLLSESPLRLRLSWKRGRTGKAQFIGVFDLNLPGLLAAHHVRLEPGETNAIRLRFYHGTDEVIYIQVNSQSPGLPIGRMP